MQRVFSGAVLSVCLIFNLSLLLADSNSYGHLPLAFEPNRGQAPANVEFLVHGQAYSLLLSPAGAEFNVRDAEGHPRHFGMRFIGAKPARISGRQPIETRTNYLLGGDRRAWITNVPNYQAVFYRQLYQGVDLLFYGNQRQLEYDLVLSPNADPTQIRFALDGFTKLTLNGQGDLVLSSAAGDLIQRKPVVYEECGHQRRRLEASYIVFAKNQVGFAVPGHRRGSRLVIDPVLIYSTFLGGSGQDAPAAIAVDTSGNAYVAGTTTSVDFPTLNPEQAANAGGAADIFIAKLNASGTALVYSTYIGGSGMDTPASIAVDSSGNAYVTGTTWSANFPLTPGAFQTSGNPINGDAFVLKLDPAGSSLVYSTYLGGNLGASATGIAIDTSGNVYIVGDGTSEFPTTPGAYQTSGNSGTFLTKLNSSGTALLFSTLFGGLGGAEHATAVAVDSAGSAYMTGYTGDLYFPTTPGAFQSLAGDSAFGYNLNASFVAKFTPDGSGLVYSTGLHGFGDERSHSIAIDSSGDAYVTGYTTNPVDFPVTTTLAQSPTGNFFVTEFNPTGSGLVFSLVFGAGGGLPSTLEFADGVNQANQIALDPAGNVIVGGSVQRSDFPFTSDAVESVISYQDAGNPLLQLSAFVAKIGPQGAGLVYSTLLGGGQGHPAFAADHAGNVYVAGTSDVFPATSGAYQTSARGVSNAFIAKVSDGSCNVTISPDYAVVGLNGGPLTVAVTANNGCGWAAVSNASWANITAGSTGSGSGSVTVNVASNTGTTQNAELSIAGKQFILYQQSYCQYTVVYNPQPLSSAAGTAATFGVSVSAGCPVQVSTTADWLTVTANAITASANGGVSRSATVVIAGQIYIITQPGAGCTYTFTPPSLTIPATGGTATIQISTAPGCSWSAVSNSPSVSLSGAAQSNASGPLTVVVGSDSVNTQTFTLDIAGQTYTITETGAFDTLPFGSFDTPANNITGVSGALGLTGWALSVNSVSSLGLWREPVGSETGSLILLGYAEFVPGSRPDVAADFPGYLNNNYGWGFQLLTNVLPNSNGSPGLGNGTYQIQAIATDPLGNATVLGVKTITVNNSTAQVPFGTIDTPGQGFYVSGMLVNFGWALTPNPANVIPLDGSTIWVFIDNQPVGHPVYNNFRADIAGLFPGLQNSNGAVGYYIIDTTKLTNGLHTIAWSVADSAGNSQGIGSRYFNVQN